MRIQEKLRGLEYGLDVIDTLKGKCQNTIVKKYAIRSGKTDCAEMVYSSELKAVGKVISEKLHHIANLDVDIFLDGDTSYILEMNASSGGGYSFNHMAVINLSFAAIVK